MKILVPLAVLVFAGCAAPDPSSEAPTSSTEQASIVTTKLGGPDANLTDSWIVGTSSGQDLWPTGQGITQTQILIVDAIPPPGATALPAQYLAFVVWNHQTVGKIYLIQTGSSTGTDFKHTWDATLANRGSVQYQGGGADGYPTTAGGPPHPNVDGGAGYSFGPAFLSHVKGYAAQIDQAALDLANDQSISSLN